MLQRTFVMLKPDAVGRGLIGEIISRFEKKGLRILALKLIRLTEQTARKQYAEHEGRDFYEPLVRYVSSGPVVVMVIGGKNAIPVVRKLLGATTGSEAKPGTIRGDFATSNRFNLVHASDSLEKAEFEISLYFDESEILNFEPPPWTLDLSGPEPV